MKKIDFKLTEGEFENPLNDPVETPQQLFSIIRGIKDFAQETLFVIYLHDDLTGAYDVHSHGPSAMTMLSIKDLLGRGYMMRAKYFILAHNHPSGNPKPSSCDLATLKFLHDKASTMVDLRMLDFVVIGDDSYWSWADENGGGEYVT